MQAKIFMSIIKICGTDATISSKNIVKDPLHQNTRGNVSFVVTDHSLLNPFTLILSHINEPNTSKFPSPDIFLDAANQL